MVSIGLYCKGRSHTIDKYFQIFELTDKIARDPRFKFSICIDGTGIDDRKIIERYKSLGVEFEVHDLREEDVNSLGLSALIVICPYSQIPYKEIKVPIIYKEYGVAGIEAGTGFLLDKPAYRYADTVITDNDFYAQMIKDKYPEKDVVVGSPAFDYFYKKESVEERVYNPSKIKVLWTPHHSMSSKPAFDRIEGGCYSTFPAYKDFLVGEFLERFPNVELHIKLHPILKRRYNEYCESVGIENDFKDWMSKVKSNPRIVFHSREDYRKLFFDCDIVLNDSISFIEEYLPLDRTMFILETPEKSLYSKFGEEIIDNCYSRIKSVTDLSCLFSSITNSQSFDTLEMKDSRKKFYEKNPWIRPSEGYQTFSEELIEIIYNKYNKGESSL